MCIENRLQQIIRKRTGNGELVVNFLADTVEGKHPDAKYHHKLEAAKLLERYGFTGDDPSHEEKSHFWGLIPTPEELAATPSRHSREKRESRGAGRGDLITQNSKLKTPPSPTSTS